MTTPAAAALLATHPAVRHGDPRTTSAARDAGCRGLWRLARRLRARRYDAGLPPAPLVALGRAGAARAACRSGSASPTVAAAVTLHHAGPRRDDRPRGRAAADAGAAAAGARAAPPDCVRRSRLATADDRAAADALLARARRRRRAFVALAPGRLGHQAVAVLCRARGRARRRRVVVIGGADDAALARRRSSPRRRAARSSAAGALGAPGVGRADRAGARCS